jgi:palmitoyltransferase
METYLPVNVVLLAILGGIIGLVLTGFTAWHISLAARGTTTIECLEKTRYVSPLRKALDRRFEQPLNGHSGDTNRESLSHRLHDYGNLIIDAHANAIPGVTRAEEGEERLSPAPYPPSHGPTLGDNPNLTPAQQALSRSYAENERQRERERYQEYLNEEDSEKMPNAFDLGWRRNLAHLFGDRALLWALPVCNTTGDGWRWEPSEKFLEARDRMRQRREQDTNVEHQYYRDLYQRNQENSRHWVGGAGTASPQPTWTPNRRQDVPDRPPTSVSMQTLAPASPRPRPGDSDFEDEPESNGLLDPESGRHQRRKDTDEWRDWD